MPYNQTMLQESTSVLKLLEYVNFSSSDLFVMLMVISLYFILILALKRFEFVPALWASSFVMFFMSAFLTFAGLLNFMFPLFFLTVVAAIAVYTYTNNQ